MTDKLSTKVRMYKLDKELGDCFLLSFTDETRSYHVLMDCGSYWNSNDSPKKFKKIVKNIQDEIGETPLDLVIATHQHNDHMSGFIHAQNAYKGMGIKQVILSWLDDEKDIDALDIAEEHGKIMKKIQHVKGLINNRSGALAGTTKRALDDLVDERTFKADNSLTGQATEFLKNCGTNSVKYLSPGDILDLPGFEENKVRIHVLGPPKDSKALKSKDPWKKESFHFQLNQLSLALDDVMDVLTTNGADKHFPFNKKYRQFPADATHRNTHDSTKKIFDEYRDKTNEWKKIDHDWLGSVNRFALHLNSYTNNTSLVLAFELVESGKILLFVGDAQAGNWRSWEQVEWKNQDLKIEFDEMMRRTVFYKVGHHGSHNATLKTILDKMTNEELVAFIPVDKRDPNIANRQVPWKMPAKNLYKELIKKTKGRIARMDEGKIKHNSNNWPRGSFKDDKLFVEYRIKG